MDLTKLEPIDFRTRLKGHESLAITVRKRGNEGLVRKSAGTLVGGAAFTGGMYLLGLLMNAIGSLPLLLALPLVLLGTTAVVLLTLGAVYRFVEPNERRLLAAISEPDAKDFLDDNWLRRDRLLAEASAFNEALEAFKALPARAGQDEIDEGVVANLAERRADIEAGIEAYLKDFLKATDEERTRVAATNARQKRLPSPHRQSMRDYRRKRKLLIRLERSLGGLAGSAEAGTTMDLSPYQAVVRFRTELEEERLTLLRCGFKPRKLPKPPTPRKLLSPGK